MEKELSAAAEKLGVNLVFSCETEPLGTAGPIALAKDYLLDSSESFIVLNSDIICEFPFKDLIRFHHTHNKQGTIVITKVEEPSKYGVIVYNENNCVVRFVEKPQEFISNKINAGIYMFKPSIITRIQLRPTSVEKEIFPNMAYDKQLYAFELDGFWMDVGQPKDFLQGTYLYLKNLREKSPEQLYKGFDISGNVLIDCTASIGKDCEIGPNVIIGPGVTIDDGVRIKKCTILSNSRIKSHSWLENCIIGWNCTIGKWVRIEGTSVLGKNVVVNDEIYINGGQVLPHTNINNSIYTPQVIL